MAKAKKGSPSGVGNGDTGLIKYTNTSNELCTIAYLVSTCTCYALRGQRILVNARVV